MTNRDAIIDEKMHGTILVRCYEDDVLVRTYRCAPRYAEDTAEDWINGIIKND